MNTEETKEYEDFCRLLPKMAEDSVQAWKMRTALLELIAVADTDFSHDIRIANSRNGKDTDELIFRNIAGTLSTTTAYGAKVLQIFLNCMDFLSDDVHATILKKFFEIHADTAQVGTKGHVKLNTQTKIFAVTYADFFGEDLANVAAEILRRMKYEAKTHGFEKNS